jgi:long-chain fatty acid transport protein
MFFCFQTLLTHGLCTLFWRKNALLLLILAVISGLCGWTTDVYAGGFALVQQGTAAMAQGNAFVAEANDASAIFYNPAGINQIKTPQVYIGTFLNYPDRNFSGEGQDSQTNHRIYTSMTTFIAFPVHKRVAVGIGFFSPFGEGTVWPPTWEGRYISTYASLKTYTLNPVVSVKVLDNLSIAGGIDFLWSKVKLKHKVQVLGGALPDGEFTLNGGGSGMGYNFGLLYEPLSGIKLGVAYRSRISVNHHGDLTAHLPQPLPSNLINGSAAITYPASLTTGISYSRFKPFTFEFDVTWTGWSSYSKLKVRLDQPLNGVSTFTTPKNWHDAWAFRFGANYEVWKGFKIRAGYIYDLTPVPDTSLDPQVPDSNRHIFTVGGDMKVFKRFTLGFAYNYILAENRTKNNTIVTNGVPAPVQANGKYSGDNHSLGLSCTFQF